MEVRMSGGGGVGRGLERKGNYTSFEGHEMNVIFYFQGKLLMFLVKMKKQVF